MTIQEIRQALTEQPEIVTLLREYKKARDRNPRQAAQALPVILKTLTGDKQHGKMEGFFR